MSDDAATLHRVTRHGSPLDAADRRRLVAFRPLDPSNRPALFKRYVAREPVPLTRDFGVSSARAADVLSGGPGVVEAPWDAKRLARLLFFSNGVSRTSGSAFGETIYFSTAMSAGNLHPIEIYVVCGDLDGVPAGVHHFAPLEFGLTELRRGDYRGALARAGVDPRVTEAPVTLVVSGIPWRTGWKYAERGFRHLYWDAGPCSRTFSVSNRRPRCGWASWTTRWPASSASTVPRSTRLRSSCGTGRAPAGRTGPWRTSARSRTSTLPWRPSRGRRLSSPSSPGRSVTATWPIRRRSSAGAPRPVPSVRRPSSRWSRRPPRVTTRLRR